MVFHGTILVFHRAERRRRKARHETYITPKLVTTRRSTLGPPAEGRPGPSDDDDEKRDATRFHPPAPATPINIVIAIVIIYLYYVNDIIMIHTYTVDRCFAIYSPHAEADNAIP